MKFKVIPCKVKVKRTLLDFIRPIRSFDGKYHLAPKYIWVYFWREDYDAYEGYTDTGYQWFVREDKL